MRVTPSRMTGRASLFPYAGMIRFRFEGYRLSPWAGTPNSIFEYSAFDRGAKPEERPITPAGMNLR